MNASVQALRAIPELQVALTAYVIMPLLFLRTRGYDYAAPPFNQQRLSLLPFVIFTPTWRVHQTL